MSSEELHAAAQAWSEAQRALDTALSGMLPPALAADASGGEALQALLTPEQSRLISELYGRAVGSWALYRERLRELHAD